MVDFEKSTRVLEELEANANDLKKFSDVYKELGTFQDKIDSSRQLLDKFTGDSIQVFKDVAANNEELQVNLQKMVDSSRGQFQTLNQENKAYQAEIKSLLVSNTQEILENAHKFQRELDSAIFSRLERHKSDIEVEIRGQLVQVERVLTSTLSSSFNSMEANVTEKIAILEKKVFTLTLLSAASLLGLVGLSVMLFKS